MVFASGRASHPHGLRRPDATPRANDHACRAGALAAGSALTPNISFARLGMGSGVSDSANSLNRQDINSLNKRTSKMNRVSAALHSAARRAAAARLLALSPRSAIGALAVALSLAACGGSPSESDVRAALSKQVD